MGNVRATGWGRSATIDSVIRANWKKCLTHERIGRTLVVDRHAMRSLPKDQATVTATRSRIAPPAPTASRRSLRAIELLLVLAAAALITMLAAASSASAASNVLFGSEQNGGMDGADQRKDLLDRQKDVGSQVIRYVVRWDRIATCNPGAQGAVHTNACYNFATPDAVAAGSAERGMQVIFSIYGAPAWANGAKGETYTGGTDAEFNTFAARYADFVQAVTTRYDGRNGQTRVTRYTIWNEPNGQFWTPLRDTAGQPIGAHRYAKLYDLASRRLKAVDPTIQVAVGPTAPIATKNIPPMEWAPIVAADLTALGSPIDAWAHNAYMGTQNPFNHNLKSPHVGLGNVTDLTNLLDSHAGTRGRPLWITEFGYQTPPSSQASVSVPEQARLLQEAMRYAFAHSRITMFIWYSVLDDDIRQNPLGFQSGLFFADNTCGTLVCPKPSAASFRHPIWLSQIAGGKITLWGRGGRTPASTRIFVKRPGDGWRAYANTDTATTGAVTVTIGAVKGTIVMTCDTVCGPQRTVGAGAVVGNKVVKKKLAAKRLPKRAALALGVATEVKCTNCKVTGIVVAPRGKVSGIAAASKKEAKIGSAIVRKAAGRSKVHFVFAKSAKPALTKKRLPRIVLRLTVRMSDGSVTVFDRAVTLK